MDLGQVIQLAGFVMLAASLVWLMGPWGLLVAGACFVLVGAIVKEMGRARTRRDAR